MDGETVRLTLALAGRSGTTDQILDALRFIMRVTRFETGCLGCDVWSDRDSTVHYREEWASEADMRRRVRSDAFTSLLMVMETASRPPDVRFEFVTVTRGLDYVAEVRDALTP
jgi:quinol monooxygenase YgiN